MSHPVVAVATMRERFAMWEFIDARYQMCQTSEGYGIETHIVEKATIYVGEGRTQISSAVGLEPGPFTHVLFLDTDTVMPEAGLKALLDHDVPVVSGLYFMRGSDADPVAYVAEEGGKMCGKYRCARPEVARFLRECNVPPIFGPILVGLIGEERPVLLPVEITGAGCLLVKKEVLSKVWNWEMEDKGEDIQWCERVRAEGFPIYLDMGVICAHLGVTPLSTAWFQASCEAERAKAAEEKAHVGHEAGGEFSEG